MGDESPAPEEAAPAADEPLSQDDLDALFDAPAAQPEEPVEAEEEPEEDDMAAAMAAMAEEEAPEEEEEVLDLPAEWQEADLVEPQEDDLVFATEEEPQEPVKEEPAAPVPSFEQAVNKTLEEQVPNILKSAFETTPIADGPLPSIQPGAPLVSDATSQQVTSAFGNLTHTILNNNSRTIENVVEDMLRPMLKAWLDQNLPIMVERLVRAEIERVSRGEQHYR
ncbi:DUF2497 domain-containing protein [uncultured Cohaesibacter sp.]|uniref:PopZ family protein n=1 Tax=uncultured Cohaesibacter sp. TaxID=1002546 RepID=UPI002931617B|nr:DUF2497 domain-containing protein [uncultured Cohaesibacter sp.]